MKEENFHQLTIPEALLAMRSSLKGLSSKEARKRLAQNGPNKIPGREQRSLLYFFTKQLANPIIYILAGAGLISLFTRHFVDGIFILIVIVISVFVGFLEEMKADRSVSKLKKLVDYKAVLLRDNQKKLLPFYEIVKGDLVYLEEGDRVPADGRLIYSNSLESSEALLTGESIPIIKNPTTLPAGVLLSDRKNMVYAGSVITRGRGVFLVTATGENTEMGKIALSLFLTEEKSSPLQGKIKKFSLYLSLVLLLFNFLIFLIGIILGKNLYQMFLTSVAMVVAAVPEGLLPSLVIVLAIGMQKISRKNGLVKQMMAAETLGSVSVICTDKTGTLTKGMMRIDKIVTAQEIEEKRISDPDTLAFGSFFLLKIGLLCNNAFLEDKEKKTEELIIRGSPTEKALFLGAYEAGLSLDSLKNEKKVGEIPFDSQKKFMASLYKKNGKFFLYLKGAPEKVLSFSGSFLEKKGKIEKITSKFYKQAEEEYLSLTGKGTRVLAFAYKEIPFDSKWGKTIKKRLGEEKQFLSEDELRNLVFVGLTAISDPLRENVKEDVQRCQRAGVKTIIITGDHYLTAKKIAQELGIAHQKDNILEGSDLDMLPDKEFFRKIKRITIYARVEPRHKMRIVKSWQALGEVVAMTGDGINDSPALKTADIGIALGSGSDIAKETADLILLNNDFGVIAEAIKQGRMIFNNIKKIVIFLLTDSFTELVLVGSSLFFGWPLPILPAQILWVNLIEDTAPSISLAFDDIDEGVMEEKPYKDKKIFSKNMLWLTVFYSGIMNLLLVLIFYYYKNYFGIYYARTVVFVGLGFSSLFYIYSVRGLKKSVLSMNPFSNNLLTVSNLVGIFLFVIAIYLPFLNKILKTTPLVIFDWSVLVGYGMFSIIVYELAKRIFFHDNKY